MTRLVDRDGADTGHEAELEFKYIVNRIGVDGWAWAVSATLAAERLRETGRSSKSIALKLPVSFELWPREGYLHLNAGIAKANNSRRALLRSAAIEREVFRRTTAFAEVARDGELRFVQAGVRHWIRREKLALDFSLQRQGSGGRQTSGFILGLGMYDLQRGPPPSPRTLS